MPHDRPRCPICFNAGWHEREGGRECTHCELAIAPETALERLRAVIAAAVPRAGREGAQGPGWRLSAVALRNAAWALGLCWRNGAWRPAEPVAHRIVLGVIGRVRELPAIEALAAVPGFSRTIAVLDGDGPAPQSLVPGLHLAMRRLDSDFAAQRNHLHALVERESAEPVWVLQLDTDETPTPALLGALGWMVRAADADGLRSIGLPRRNEVDGTVSALFPDIQYRLNRSDIRFRNRVHERPIVPFAETTLGLAGCIAHRLDGARVRARSLRYEAMCAGAGRPDDEAALLQPFDPLRMAAAR